MAGESIDRFKGTFTMVENRIGFDIGKVIMYHPTNGYSFWDTSDPNNRNFFNGIIFDKENRLFYAALKGCFPTTLADGDYWCDNNGNIVTGGLPVGSFDHKLGHVKDGLFFINDTISTPAVVVGTVNWGDIGGDINNQTDLINLINEGAEISAFINCGC